MISPKNNTREFKLGELKNKIKYCLIHDKELDRSTISISVGVGSIMDPLENQGLAHFLEHMLFLGNGKYKDEKFFDDHLKKFDGYSNAYTDTFETVYYFSCLNKGLDVAIDCFSHFFIDPLFDPDCVAREILAIDSEHNKNIYSEFWRIRQLINNLSKEDSPINKFTTGNKDTFKENIRDEMIKFYNKYYTSDNITISIISNESIDELEKFMKFFSKIPIKNHQPVKDIIKKPFMKKNPFSYQLIPSSNINELLLIYEIDFLFNDWENMYYDIFTNLINSENVNSLKYNLIKNNLISKMSSYALDEGFILINFNLIKMNKENIEKVLGYYNNFLNYLKNLGKEIWENIYNFNKNKRQVLYDYGSKNDSEDTVISTSNNLHYYPKKYIYSANQLIFEKDFNIFYKKMLNLLKILKKESNKIIISQKKLEDNNIQIDKYYNMEYFELNKKFNPIEINKKFDIIYKSEYLDSKPKHLKVKNMKKPILLPSKIWYKSIGKFNEPKVYCVIQFYDKNLEDINYFVKKSLTISLIEKYIDMKFSLESKLGYYIFFGINNKTKTISLNIRGFNNNFNNYVTSIFDTIKNIKFDESVFKSIIKRKLENYSSFMKKTPWKFIEYLQIIDNYKNYFKIEDLRKELLKIKFKDIKETGFFKNLPCQIYLCGNIESESVLSKIFENNLKMNFNINLLKSSIKSNIWNHPNKKENENCISVNYLIGKFLPEKNILLILLTSIMEQPFFYELRTKQQCGYLVSIYSNKIGENYYITQKIQSSKTTDDLEKRIIKFNKDFEDQLKNIDLKRWKDTVKKNLESPNQNTYEAFSENYNEILLKQYLFNRLELLVNKLEKVKLQDLINFYKKYVLESTAIILKLN